MNWNIAENDPMTAVITADHVHNPGTVSMITSALDEITAVGGIRSVIFRSGDEKNWCIGLDIPWIMEQYKSDNRAALKEFFMQGSLAVFLRMLTLPFVSTAAISGHAFGNGVVFALFCDYRFMRSGRGYFCLPEADMGLTDAFPPSALKLMDIMFPPFIKDVMIPTGKKVTAEELVENKIISGCFDNSEAVMRAALDKAAEISADESLYRKIIDVRISITRPVQEAIKHEDPASYDYIIERFWQFMKSIGVNQNKQ